jgi:two-component system nitrogen regulation sensor histidine kinase NtrY
VADLAGQIQSNPLSVQFTKPHGATSEVVDLTNALNRLTEDLRRAERAAGTAQVARRVAHEIRNPLSTLGLAVGRLERRFDALPPDDRRVTSEVIAAMRKEFEVLDDMAESFSVLGSMAEPPLRRPVDWNVLAQSVRALYGETSVRFQLELDEGLPPVAGDERSLRRALTNLVKNAIEAQDGGGSVTVRTARQAGQALVEVRDEGPGLSPAARERLFVPGFTTKEGGSGLGLFLARSIVEHHGGRVEVDSSAAGTIIRLRFPAAGAIAPAA